MYPKIAIIGAGSGAFSLSMIRDICLTPNLRGCTVHFMDIDPDRLDGVYHLTRRYAAEMGIELDVHKTLNRQECLDGADFVINTALSAGHHRLRAGWEVARKYGYRHGGSLAIMHDEAFWIDFYQLRLFESIVNDIIKICPKAYYLQVANSVLGGITFLSRKYPQVNMVGLCHGYNGVYHLAQVLGLDHDGLTFELPGVNHFIWLTKMYYKGVDVFPLLDRWVENDANNYFETCSEGDDIGPKAVDLYKRFGAFPIGDTCTDGGGSWGWWYHTDRETQISWKQNPDAFWNGYFHSVDWNAKEIQRISQDQSVKVSDHFPPRHSGETMVPLVESLAFDIPRTYNVNVPNTGSYVPGVPTNFAVEVWGYASKRGIQAIQTGGLPPMALAYLIKDRVVPVELELAAYANHDRKLLLELIRLDPWTRSEAQASAFLDDLLALPFHTEMREHYQD